MSKNGQQKNIKRKLVGTSGKIWVGWWARSTLTQNKDQVQAVTETAYTILSSIWIIYLKYIPGLRFIAKKAMCTSVINFISRKKNKLSKHAFEKKKKRLFQKLVKWSASDFLKPKRVLGVHTWWVMTQTFLLNLFTPYLPEQKSMLWSHYCFIRAGCLRCWGATDSQGSWAPWEKRLVGHCSYREEQTKNLSTLLITVSHLLPKLLSVQ